MPVCITGMHRSGTSMVARLLNLCGLYLGPETELLPEAPDNPAGFWEHSRFVEINDKILALLGGSWNHPPDETDVDWAGDERFGSVRQEAVELLAQFSEYKMWGWKDPRTSLTLPFWQALLPDLKVVICLRSPLEVAHSLKQREISGLLDSEKDWVEATHQLGYHYYQQIWHNASTSQRLVTHYESFFYNPTSELERLLHFLGMSVPPALFDRAIKNINRELHHQRYTVHKLITSDIPTEALEMYFRLGNQAGPVYSQTETARHAKNLITNGITYLKSLTPLAAAVVQARAGAFRNQEEELNQRRVEVERANRRIVERDDTIRALRAEIKKLTHQINQLQDWKQRVTSRLSWQALEKFWSLRERIMPHGQGLDRLLFPLLVKLRLVPDHKNDRSVGKISLPENNDAP